MKIKKIVNNKPLLQKVGWAVLATVLVATLGAMMYMISTTDRVIPPAIDQGQVATDADVDSGLALGESLQDLGLDVDPELEALLDTSDVATLDTTRDKVEFGVAVRSFEDNVFSIEIIITSPPPQPTSKYEAWLVKGESDAIFIGGLEVDEADEETYILAYQTDEDLRNLDTVVVTESSASNLSSTTETKNTISGTRTMEGSF